MKDDIECECMNELFGKDEVEIEMHKNGLHWRPVAYVDNDGKEIRKLSNEEQIAWIRQQRIIIDER